MVYRLTTILLIKFNKNFEGNYVVVFVSGISICPFKPTEILRNSSDIAKDYKTWTKEY